MQIYNITSPEIIAIHRMRNHCRKKKGVKNNVDFSFVLYLQRKQSPKIKYFVPPCLCGSTVSRKSRKENIETRLCSFALFAIFA